MNRVVAAIACYVGVSCLAVLSAQIKSPAIYLPYARVSPVFNALTEPLPAPSDWIAWITASDAATRARVALGDETSVVNLLLFGTSFTNQPRITSGQLNAEQIRAAVETRLHDFERALDMPAGNERLQFARRLLPRGPALRPRLLSMLDRSVKESETHARLTEQAHALGDSSLEFAERSRLYRGRGLASDSSIRVNFAIEEALQRAYTANRGLRPVRRVAVIGPGLDVVDKQDGHDFYPPQTLQPFALIDSLVRLGLADPGSLRVATFDVSARVNDHIAEMGARARARSPYTLHLALDAGVEWTPSMLDYFDGFGDRVGSAVPATMPPRIGPLRFRAIAVRPDVVARISAHDVNITAQMLTLSDADRFDLVIATNIFVYYDRLQQGLGMASVAAMLRPGALLLSNNALVEVPATGIKSIGYSKTLYSNRDEDGDLIIWYQKQIK
jgi:hypothetical protein